MKNIHHKILQACSNLVGTPYENKHCWQVVVSFYKQVYDYELYQYVSEVPSNQEINKIVKCCEKDFIKLSSDTEPQAGDILLISLMGVECHIGVYIGGGQFLHTTKHSGCVVERLARWQSRIRGIYRVKHDRL